MGLDIYFKKAEPEKKICPHCDSVYDGYDYEDVDLNITHNLATMAKHAGLYTAIWRPEDIKIEKAGELIDVLTTGFSDLSSEPDHFSQFNASNGWGTYSQLVEFVLRYKHFCATYPDAIIEVSR